MRGLLIHDNLTATSVSGAFGLTAMLTRFIDSEISLQDMPMLIAVSCLSPVRTHTYSLSAPGSTQMTNKRTLMPAICSVWMVSGTPSWSLSSMAVAPSRNKSLSMSSAALSSASPRPLMVAAAWS